MIINKYHNSLTKRLVDFLSSLVGLILLSPIMLIISLMILLFSGSPIFFLQKRVGKNGKVFKIIKFRTMVRNASKVQNRYKKNNEADGPVFKIYNDPRFTRIGKYLSRASVDELPQLINVLNGDMSLVGPRPLPVNEANKLKKEYKYRELIKPGITSMWVVGGMHKLKFEKWMALDNYYVKHASFSGDIKIIFKTLCLIFRIPYLAS